MRAAWYERQGPAMDVLMVGELVLPAPEEGEVRVRLAFSGVNPGDIKKRQGWRGSSMPYPRVIPHSDGAGVIDAVGPRVDPKRIGTRVWVYGAQTYRPFGTAAEAAVVPDEQAVELPDGVPDEVGASLGIPGITAHRAVFADGPVDGKTVLVHGVMGAVGSLAAQLARWGGATVIGTVRSTGQADGLGDRGAVAHVVALDAADPAAAIRAIAPDGIDRIIEVALGANIHLDAAIAAQGAVIGSYSNPGERADLPYWPLAFGNVTIRLLGSDDFPLEAKRHAAGDLTKAAAAGAIGVRIGRTYRLADIAAAHVEVEHRSAEGRVLLEVG